MNLSEIYKYGLDDKQVKELKRQNKVNVSESKYTKSTLQIFKDNLLTFFNLIVIVVAISLFLVSAYIQMLFFTIILINIAVGIVQELIAKKLVESLSLLSASNVMVIRNNEKVNVKREGLVVGDLMYLDSNKQINCDSKIIYGEVEVNEALLTGEYDPIVKSVGDELLSGSFIVSGEVYAKVEHVGSDNYAEKIAMEAKKHKKTHSELMAAIDKAVKLTTFVVLPAGILLFISSYMLSNHSLSEAIIATSAAIISMLPIGVILLITTSLAVGIIKLARLKVLAQDLYAIEALSRVDLLCLDKTGTITKGMMSVKEVFIHDNNISVDDVNEIMSKLLGASKDNNSTFIALKNHFNADDKVEIVNQINFSSQIKYSSVSFDKKNTYYLGAPEILIPNNRPKKLDELLNTDQRIILLAASEFLEEPSGFSELKPIASIVIEDPLRDNVKETLAFFKEQGVIIKIISGDNPHTVSSIANKAGFEDYDAYIDISSLNEEELMKVANEYTIFGRSSPKQKRVLINAFKSYDHSVAMTGDGVNDVLALKEADVGIAMAQGSDAAKYVSQLVLIDSDFTNLPKVVDEGRRVVNNITKVSSVYFVKIIYSAILTILCILTLTAYPFNPIQITIINAFIVAIPTFFITFEKNQSKISNNFLSTTIANALPPALSIIIIISFLYLISNFISINEMELKTMMYYVVATMTYLTIVRASKPHTLFIKGLLTFSFVAFALSMIFFSEYLELARLNLITIVALIFLNLVAYYLIKQLARIANRLIKRVDKASENK